MIFLWSLTWYSYWIFMRNQINAINIIGASISAGLFVSSHFSPVRDAASKAPKLVTSQIRRNIHLTHTSLGSQSNIKMQLPPATFTTRIQAPRSNKLEKSIGQTTVLKTQKQEPESLEQTTSLKTQKQEPDSIQFEDECQQLPSKSNGCPKNMDYFTKKPRPKQIPEECITCKNLINCVCLTSN